LAINCPVCGAENPDSADFCNLCLASMGFEASEYTTPAPVDEGFLDKYPSSFDPGAPSAEEVAASAEVQEAPPVDIGEYGVRSGQDFDEAAAPAAPGPAYGEPKPAPSDYGYQEPGQSVAPPYDPAAHQLQYQQPQPTYQQPPVEGQYRQQPYPAPGQQAPGEAWQQGYAGSYGEPARASRPFDWTRAIMLCAGAAAIAALMSIGLELFFSFIGYSVAMSTSVSIGLILVFLSLLIPVAFASFSCGYKLERYGWLVGLISVGMWAFIFRPLYYAILSWMLTERFTFTAVFSKYSLAFIFGLFLPLGALIGWLGEKRATTGLFF
jgi:hypothetical protein